MRVNINLPVRTCTEDVLAVLGECSCQCISFFLLCQTISETFPLVGIRLSIVLQLFAKGFCVCQPVFAIVCKYSIDLSLDALTFLDKITMFLFHADDFISIGLHGCFGFQLSRICLSLITVEWFLLVNQSVDFLLQEFGLVLCCFKFRNGLC